MKTYVVYLSLLAFLFSSCALTLRNEEIPVVQSVPVAKIVPASPSSKGLVYALPKTGLRFCVTAEKVTKKRGEFYLYSERYLGLKNVILEDATEWRIKNIVLEPFAIANLQERFEAISGSGNYMPFFSLSEDGVLQAVNSPLTVEEKASVAINKTTASFTAPYTEEMMLANSTAKMAEEAARYIYRLRENRTALLSAELEVLPPDGQAYAMSLDKIQDLEDQFLSLFKGSETCSEIKTVVELVPDAIQSKALLFRFSSFNGLVAKEDLSGSPIFIQMTALQEAFEKKSNALPDTAGLFYKRPMPLEIKVMDGLSELLSTKVMMAQFGVIQTLPVQMMNADVKIQLYPTSGAIKAITK